MNAIADCTDPDILEFSGDFAFLSNFAPVVVVFDGIEYSSVEHAYVAAKTLDLDQRALIAAIIRPGQVKRFGRSFQIRQDWELIKVDVMTDLVTQKFCVEPYKSLLINTGGARIEETNEWGDTFWGVCRGRGENTLGKILMRIRSA